MGAQDLSQKVNIHALEEDVQSQLVGSQLRNCHCHYLARNPNMALGSLVTADAVKGVLKEFWDHVLHLEINKFLFV